MLNFHTDENQNFVVTQTIMSAVNDMKMVVRYTPDLSHKQVNNEPWRETDEVSRDWFAKNYTHKFGDFYGQ